MPGPPLTQDSAIMHLISHGVVVGIGSGDELKSFQARNLPFDIAWVSLFSRRCLSLPNADLLDVQAAIEAGGRLSKEEALAIGSVNLEKLLGAEVEEGYADLVATKGGDLLEMSSKVVAVISPARKLVHLMG